jgi:hypothetical protein
MKAREFNHRAFLLQLRSSWAAAVNAQLERAGRSERVDHRSLAAQRQEALEQGDYRRAALLDRRPEGNLSLAAAAIEHRARLRNPTAAPVTEQGRLQAEIRRERAAVQVLVGEQQDETDLNLAPVGIKATKQRQVLRVAVKALEAKETRLVRLQAALEEERLVLARERQAAAAQERAQGYADGWAAARQTFGGGRAKAPNPPERPMAGASAEPSVPDQPQAPAAAGFKARGRPASGGRRKETVA